MITYRRLERVLTYILIALIGNSLFNLFGIINNISSPPTEGPNLPSNIGFLAITLPASAFTIYLLRKLSRYHKLPPWQNPENRPLPPKPKRRRKPPQPAKLQVPTWAQKPFNTREITWMIPFFLFGGIYALSDIETAGHPGQPDSLIFQNLVIGSLMLAMVPIMLRMAVLRRRAHELQLLKPFFEPLPNLDQDYRPEPTPEPKPETKPRRRFRLKSKT